MDQLAFELRFMHKFNLHKKCDLIIDDYDLVSMARVYGVKLKELKNSRYSSIIALKLLQERSERNLV